MNRQLKKFKPSTPPPRLRYKPAPPLHPLWLSWKEPQSAVCCTPVSIIAGCYWATLAAGNVSLTLFPVTVRLCLLLPCLRIWLHHFACVSDNLLLLHLKTVCNGHGTNTVTSLVTWTPVYTARNDIFFCCLPVYVASLVIYFCLRVCLLLLIYLTASVLDIQLVLLLTGSVT